MNKSFSVKPPWKIILRSFSEFSDNFKPKMATLETLKFDNLALRKLPIDPEPSNYVRTVNGACFSKVSPTPVLNPKVVAISPSAMGLLDLPATELKREDLAEYFSGNKLLPGSETAAHCYCGHQFGYFSGQLGDGAAMYLGEIINSKNERWEIQLKGAGLTPYSRTADGRKVLRSSIREFLCSEAMHFLGIPTTRAGTCITSDSEVIRDIFYDGNPKSENCSVVLRIAPTFIRFGSFEIFKILDRVTGKMGPSVGRTDILHSLLSYVIETFYPEIHQSTDDQQQKYAAFFKEVVLRTARLVALWQSVGFCHGVLNTDNMSVLGLTLDYGPFGFMDMYDSSHICNGSDDSGRYSFIKQPEICLWNLKKFAEAIEQALPLSESSRFLELYENEFNSTYLNKMRAKLGLILTDCPDDENLIKELFTTMEETGSDFTNTFRCFLFIDASDDERLENSFKNTRDRILDEIYPLKTIISALKPERVTPQMQTLLMLANADPSLLEQLGRMGLTLKTMLSKLRRSEKLEEMTQDDKDRENKILWDYWLENYKKRLIKDRENSLDFATYNEDRQNSMKQNNPKFILRNYIAQNAIDKAEAGDYSEVQLLCELLEKPYELSYSTIKNSSHNVDGKKSNFEPSTSVSTKSSCKSDDKDILEKPPDWSFSMKVT